MKLHSLTPTLVAVLLLGASPLSAQDKPAKSDKPAAQPSMDEMMKRWQEAATPGPAHKALDALIGDWDLDSKMWMAPGAPPTETKGTVTNRWILGGRFVQSEITGTMMGMPMNGISLTGYDNFKKKYINVWLDNMGTAVYVSEGVGAEAGKSFIYHSKMDDPMTGEKDKPFKFVMRIESADRHTMEMHELAAAGPVKVMEMTYTRRKR